MNIIYQCYAVTRLPFNIEIQNKNYEHLTNINQRKIKKT